MNQSHLARLYWRCRRGMLELDLMLIPFLENCYSDLSEKDKASFEELITATDPDLFSWLTQNGEPDKNHLAKMVEKIRDYAKNRH